jgi:hypothetical protein
MTGAALAIFRDSLCTTAGPGTSTTRPRHAASRGVIANPPTDMPLLSCVLVSWSHGNVTTAADQRAAQASRDSTGLIFAAEMYGLQLDQLGALLSLTKTQARALVSRWTSRGLAESATLGPGPPWVWVTRAGLAACGVRYAAAPPALARLAHIRAVTAIRLALEAVPAYRDAGAHWRSERHLRARLAARARDHLPDGEVHWPDIAPVAWAGECWAIEAELTPKTVVRTSSIMRELLTRTGDYGCPAAEARVPGAPPRHARAIYLCSPAAAGTVARARDALASQAARIDVRGLPAGTRVLP